jgi:hypothetical protein
LAGFLLLALVRVELLLNGRLRVSHVGVSRELDVAIFTDSEHWNVPDSFHDPKIALWHEASFPYAGVDCYRSENSHCTGSAGGRLLRLQVTSLKEYAD